MRQYLVKIGVIGLSLFLCLLVIAHGPLMAASAADETRDPVKKPEARLSPEIPIASDDSDGTGWFHRYKWWLAGGVVVVAGSLTAIMASGGSADGDDGGAGVSSSDSGGNITPSTQYRIEW